jgi:hypothetical protein
LAEALRALGHDALATEEIGAKGTPDHLQLIEARERGRRFVTHNNRDFRLLHRAWRDWPNRWGVAGVPSHPGILILAQDDGAGGKLGSARLASLVDGFATDANHGRLDGRAFGWSRLTGWREIG